MAFAGYHVLVLVHFIRLPWAVASACVLALVAWAWRQVAMRRGGLAVPLVSHALAGLSLIAGACVLASR